MLRSYLLTAWRNLWKARFFSVINIVGLTAGMVCSTIIFLYVRHEYSFDKYHKNASQIYRVAKNFVNPDGTRIPDATTPPALAPALRQDLPEVASATRMFPAWGRKYLIQYGDKSFYETGVIRVDSNFFNVFDFPFSIGNKENAFKGKLSILLTETSAKKYFGNADPIGKLLRINVNNGQDFLVTGVLKDVPQNSHFSFDFLIPFISRNDSTLNSNWDWHSFYTYARLKPSADADIFKRKLQPLFAKYQPESKNEYFAQALTDIHLKSKLKWELGANSDLSYMNILVIIAVFVIIIAGVNYVNLVTAQSAKRAKEVGVRKVAGASRYSLIMQFLAEATVTSFISFAFSMVIVAILLPFVNQVLDRHLSLFSRDQVSLWIQLIAATMFIGICAGLYPAFYLSSFQPVRVLKGKFITSSGGTVLRKTLVVFQFFISIVLLVSFFTIYRQVDFVSQKNLGFDKDNILMLPNVRSNGLPNTGAPGSWLEDLKQIPAVTGVARADGILGGVSSVTGIGTKNSHISLNFMRIDHEFLPTFEIKLIEGRNFFGQSSADSLALILNESAVKQLGLKKPLLGQQLSWDDESGKTHDVTLVGIVKDFHFTSLHEPIKPFGFISEEGNGSTFFVKLHSQNLTKDIASIQKAWTRHSPDKPFEYTFQDEQIAKLYQFDMRFKNLFSYVTVLAILIASLGLLGLCIFTAEARAKEIGVRKILGASVNSLFTLLSKEFFLLIVIAIVIASPIAWWAMNGWLQNFAYRVDIPWWVFVTAGMTAIFIALVTISFHILKAAVANPIKSLRTD